MLVSICHISFLLYRNFSLNINHCFSFAMHSLQRSLSFICLEIRYIFCLQSFKAVEKSVNSMVVPLCFRFSMESAEVFFISLKRLFIAFQSYAKLASLFDEALVLASSLGGALFEPVQNAFIECVSSNLRETHKLLIEVGA